VSPLQPQEASTATISVVVMGVSGSGKTTVAKHLVELLGWPFAEGDDFHPPANVAKMRSGKALSDRDRKPWLAAAAGWIGEQELAGRSAIVTCSALKRAYREALSRDHPSVWFVHVSSSPDRLRHRLETRSGHYMPASLLASQLESFESLEPDEPGVTVSGEGAPDVVATRVLDALRDERGRRLRWSGEAL
jgi:gluconokinase